MRIRAILLHMAESEIKKIIPPYVMDDIKQKDPKPLFRAYVVGQEGQAEANWVGVGKLVKTWFASAIGSIVKKLWPGLKIFHNHSETNEHEGRTQIGEVAGSKATMIDDKTSAIAVAYIYPEYRELPLDVASIEVEVNIDPTIPDGVHADDVADVTGIALGNSKVNRPGFPGATLLGELQAMAEKSGIGHEIPNKLKLGFSVNNTDQQDKLKLVEEA